MSLIISTYKWCIWFIADISSQLKAEPLSDLDDIIEEDEDINQSKQRDTLTNVHTGMYSKVLSKNPYLIKCKNKKNHNIK